MGIDSSSLGKILRGERGLPQQKAELVLKSLELSPSEKRLFLKSLKNKESDSLGLDLAFEDERYLLDESYFKVISEWEHYAVLELFDLHDFKVSVLSIAKRLSLSNERSEVVLRNLLQSKLVLEVDGNFQKAYEEIKTTEDITSLALRKSHLETLDLGKDKLEEIDLRLRDYSSLTVAIDPEQIDEAKLIIRDFRKKMSELFSKGEKSEVYNLAIQLYPLTHIEHTGEKQ